VAQTSVAPIAADSMERRWFTSAPYQDVLLDVVSNLRQAVGLRIVRIADEGSAFPLRIAMFAPCDIRTRKRRRTVDDSGTGIKVQKKCYALNFSQCSMTRIITPNRMLRRSIEFVSIETKTDRTV
jgi:hypothetical protein